MLNDGITHLIKAHITVCWEQVTGIPDLQDFVSTEPTMDVINKMAHQIFIEHFPGTKFNDLQDQPDAECDKKGENQLLFN